MSWLRKKVKKCKHKFNSDGGKCVYCNRTIEELISNDAL